MVAKYKARIAKKSSIGIKTESTQCRLRFQNGYKKKHNRFIRNILSAEDFFATYPDGQILLKETGHTKSMERYGKNVYRMYDSIGNRPYARFFKAAEVDNRLSATERLIDIQDGAFSKIYPFTILKKKGVLNDTFKPKKVLIFFQEGARSH